MKFLEKISIWNIASLLFLALLCVGCGDDSSTASDNGTKPEYVRTLEDLDDYECTSAREGLILILSEDEERMICHSKRWVEYSGWSGKSSSSVKSSSSGKSSSSAKSSSSIRSSSSVRSSSSRGSGSDSAAVCQGKRDCLGSFQTYSDLPSCGDSLSRKFGYVESQERFLICLESRWVEYYSSGYGRECTAEIQGMGMYNSSTRDTLVCVDGEWYSIRNFFIGERVPDEAFDAWHEIPLEHDLIHFITDSRDSLFEPCTAAKEGSILYDKRLPGYSENGYYRCIENHWYPLPDSVADTVGLEKAPEGSFAIARFSKDTTYARMTMSKGCLAYSEKPYPVYYVYKEDGWRRASTDEICELHACLKSMEGEIYYMLGFRFRCENQSWVQDSILNTPKEDLFNPAVTYGQLKDPRDGHVYRTIDIGGRTWMAENLNYHDDSENMKNKNFCYDDSTTCERYGRYYEWTAAMNIASKYEELLAPDFSNDEERRGICPEGWHIPDSLEWNSLLKIIPYKELMTEYGWELGKNSSSVTANTGYNQSGFSVAPMGYRRSGYYSSIGAIAFFAVSNQRTQTESKATYFSQSYARVGSAYKYDAVSVRCIKNLGEE